MIVRFLMWLTARLPVEIITHEGVPFLERYYLGRLPGWQLYLHRFIASDPDGLHDHPWRFGVSILLAGYYLEEDRYGIRRVRWINFVPGTKFHRVILPRQCWSLFAHTARCKSWGFLRGSDRVFRYSQVSGNFRGVPFSDWHKRAPRGRDVTRAA